MEHTLLIAQNNLRSLDFHQAFQAVVADNDATVEIVQVGRGETASVQRHERTQLGRYHRNDFENHPFRTVDPCAGPEGFNNLQALQGLRLTLLARVVVGAVAQLVRDRVQVQIGQQIIDGFSSHLGNELIGVRVLQPVIVWIQLMVDDVQIFIFREKVHDMRAVEFGTISILTSLQDARLDYYIFFVVYYRIKFLGWHPQQVTNLVRQGAEVPNVCHGHHQFNMSGSLAAHFLFRDLNATAVADDSLVTNTLVLTASALVVFRRTEDAFTEQAIPLGLVGTVIDCFRFGHLTV